MLEHLKAPDASMATIPVDETIGNQQAREVAYIAGLMDGEGTFCLECNENHRYVRFTPRISMGVTCQALADRFRYFLEKYDISYYQSKRIYPEPYLPVYCFEVRRLTMVKKFLELVMSDLVGKQRQAALMLRFVLSRLDENGNVRYRGNTKKLEGYPAWTYDVWLEMRTLNGRNKPKKDVKASKISKHLARLNDHTSSCTVIYGPTKDMVSPALKDAAVQQTG